MDTTNVQMSHGTASDAWGAPGRRAPRPLPFVVQQYSSQYTQLP